MTKDGGFNLRDLLELADGLVDYIEDNRGTIETMTGANRIRLEDDDPLREVIKEDDKVLLTLEVKDTDFSDVRLEYKKGVLRVKYNDNVVTAKVPGDIKMEDSRIELNNGVLDITIPRGGD